MPTGESGRSRCADPTRDHVEEPLADASRAWNSHLVWSLCCSLSGVRGEFCKAYVVTAAVLSAWGFPLSSSRRTARADCRR